MVLEKMSVANVDGTQGTYSRHKRSSKNGSVLLVVYIGFIGGKAYFMLGKASMFLAGLKGMRSSI